jgi:hypothetical protein
MQKPILKKPVFKMYQEVVLIRESVKDNFFGEPVTVRKGQRGVVMLICKVPDVPSIGYAVEFFDKKGETIAVSIVEESDIAAMPEGRPDVKAVKQRRKNKPKSCAA